MNEFLTVAQTIKLTGKNRSTITRFASRYEHSENVKKENGSWYIRREFLEVHYHDDIFGPLDSGSVPDEVVPNTHHAPSAHEPEQPRPQEQSKESPESRSLKDKLILKIVEEGRQSEKEAAERNRENSQKLIGHLEDENRHLKHQLEKKDIKIANFQERTRELHHLLNNQAKLLEGIKEAQ